MGRQKLVRGRESVKTLLTDNPELTEEIEKKIIANYTPSMDK